MQADIRGDTNFFTSANIKACIKKVSKGPIRKINDWLFQVIAVNLHEIVQVDETLSIRLVTELSKSSRVWGMIYRFSVRFSMNWLLFVPKPFFLSAFYAGHVLGAAMFEVRVGCQSILYTGRNFLYPIVFNYQLIVNTRIKLIESIGWGDFNMTPDRHLGAARVLPGLKPDLLISESTYATTIRLVSRFHWIFSNWHFRFV